MLAMLGLGLGLGWGCGDTASDGALDAGTSVPLPTPTVEAGVVVDAAAPVVDAASAALDAATEDRNMGNSAGCGRANAGTGLQTRTMMIAGVERSYLRFIPVNYDPNTPLAVVLAFHGSGGTSERARTLFDMEGEAKGNAIFIYPQALPDAAGDNRWDPIMGSNDYAYVDALMAEVERTHCVDRDRVFAVGFSLGARFTSMLGCYRGDKLRAIATGAPGGSPTTLPLSKCVGEVAIWGSLGNQDDELHKTGVSIVRTYYSGANGCTQTLAPVAPAGCEAYQGCRAEVPMTWCGFTGGHMWPAFGPQAAWAFFNQFK